MMAVLEEDIYPEEFLDELADGRYDYVLAGIEGE
jgi:hypothetical protein